MSLFPSPSGPPSLDQAGHAWFNTLKNKYLALKPSLLAPTLPQKAAMHEIDRILGVAPVELLQSHLADLEDWLIALLSGADLKQWLNSLRDDYREIFGADALARILPTLVAQISAAADADLVAEARRLQAELHWHYSLQPWALEKRQEMMAGILLTLIFVVLAAGVLWLISGWLPHGNGGLFAALLALLGTLGGSISSIQRVQSADFSNARAVSVARQERFALSVVLSPLQGGFFAVIFTLLLVAGVATPGFVVPNVHLQSPECPYSTNAAATTTPPTAPTPTSSTLDSKEVSTPVTNAMKSSSRNLAIRAEPKDEDMKQDSMTAGIGASNASPPVQSPQKGAKEDQEKSKLTQKENGCCFPFFNLRLCFGSGKDLALLLIWTFIAGFSERLVPDLLTRMAEKGKA